MKKQVIASIGLFSFITTTVAFGKWARQQLLEDEVSFKTARAYLPHRIIPDHKFPLGEETADLMQVSAIIGVIVRSPLGQREPASATVGQAAATGISAQ